MYTPTVALGRAEVLEWNSNFVIVTITIVYYRLTLIK